ncbi:MAG: hypothetical protein AAF990_01425 [Bacteroidota bacterium]
MKRYLILLFISPFFLSSSCQKDDLGISRSINGLLNGNQWQAEGNFTYNLPHNIGLDIRFEVYSSQGIRREKLLLYKVPFEVGVYPILVTTKQINEAVTGAVYRTFSHDGDVIKDTYRLYTSADNAIKIAEVDAEKNIIKGEVNATFLVDPYDVEDTDVDTIRIENGIFEITLRD